ncbi:MAG: glycosyltransferase, partial [Planctomycetota bacterium]
MPEPEAEGLPEARLDDVLVLTTRKTFWATPAARLFSRVLHTWILFGRSGNFWNAGILFFRALFSILFRRPKVLVIGSAPRLSAWFARLKKRGLLGRTKLLAVGHLEFGYDLVPHFARIVVHARAERDIRERESGVRGRYAYLPLPASGVKDRAPSARAEDFLFAGGRAKRDFRTLIKAVKSLPVRLRIVTRDRSSIDWPDPLPGNVEFRPFKPLEAFLQDLRDARFVVVPLFGGERFSHGQTTVVQAMRLGRAVISTRGATVDDYVVHGETGLLVEP